MTLIDKIKRTALGAGLIGALATSACVPVGKGDWAGLFTNLNEAGQFGNQLDANQIQRDRNKIYAGNNQLPLIFTCGGGINDGEEYTEIGKTYLKEGDGPLYVVGRNPLFKSGKPIYNFRICVTTGVTFGRVKKHDLSKTNQDEVARFGLKAEHDYCPKGTWENVWVEEQPDGSSKELGRVRWTYLY